MDVTRRNIIEVNLRDVQAAIDTACTTHGRSRSEVTLIAVTKTFPASDVAHLAALGITDVGENKDQEARAKREEYLRIDPSHPLRWHLIGQLQRNKAKSVAAYADMVHSVDRVALADALDKACLSLGRRLPVLLQVDLESGADPERGGVRPDELMPLADHVQKSTSLELAGLMAVAPLNERPTSAFARLAAIRERFLADFPGAQILSAGMSHDLDAAIAHGATHVRVGSALLGSRTPVG